MKKLFALVTFLIASQTWAARVQICSDGHAGTLKIRSTRTIQFESDTIHVDLLQKANAGSWKDSALAFRYYVTESTDGAGYDTCQEVTELSDVNFRHIRLMSDHEKGLLVQVQAHQEDKSTGEEVPFTLKIRVNPRTTGVRLE